MEIKNTLCVLSSHRLRWCPTCKHIDPDPAHHKPEEWPEPKYGGTLTYTGAITIDGHPDNYWPGKTWNSDKREWEEDEPEDPHPQWYLFITKVDNGFVLEGSEGERSVIEEPEEYMEEDELNAKIAQRLCWEVMEFFTLSGSKHDQYRARIIIERGGKYEDEEDEQDGK